MEVLLVVVFICVGGLVGSAVAAAKGAESYRGFLWGAILGPIGWVIAAIVLKDRKDEKKELAEKMRRARELARQQSAPKVVTGVADEIGKLAALRSSGALTDAEYDELKQKALARG